MNIRDHIIESARSYIGVKWKHEGRTRKGLDCLGLVILVARDVGLVSKDEDYRGYSRHPDGTIFQKFMEYGFIEKTRKTMNPGDLLITRMDILPCHCMILTENNNVIHSFVPTRSVIEHPFSRFSETIVKIVQFPGIREY